MAASGSGGSALEPDPEDTPQAQQALYGLPQAPSQVRTRVVARGPRQEPHPSNPEIPLFLPAIYLANTVQASGQAERATRDIAQAYLQAQRAFDESAHPRARAVPWGTLIAHAERSANRAPLDQRPEYSAACKRFWRRVLRKLWRIKQLVELRDALVIRTREYPRLLPEEDESGEGASRHAEASSSTRPPPTAPPAETAPTVLSTARLIHTGTTLRWPPSGGAYLHPATVPETSSVAVQTDPPPRHSCGAIASAVGQGGRVTIVGLRVLLRAICARRRHGITAAELLLFCVRRGLPSAVLTGVAGVVLANISAEGIAETVNRVLQLW